MGRSCAQPRPLVFTTAKQACNVGCLPCVLVDVALVRWPTEDEKRAELALGSVPRLLLLEDGAEPPDDSDCLEDWVRLPASEVDLHARIVGLTRRADRHGGG